MKKIFLFIALCLLIFIGLTYWSLSVGPSNVDISKLIEVDTIAAKDLKNLKQVRVSATNQYSSNALKSFMQGENYRNVWEVPILAEVFYLDSFEIMKEGGGNQTQSLKIRNPKGALYSLRSINKDPAPLIPGAAKILKLENIIVDGISAQHPYGAVLAASLADAAGILHTHPRIVYVPVQDHLGEFAEKFGNRLYLLEYETEGKFNWTGHDNVAEIVETDDLQELKLKLGDRLKVDIRQLVKARLFDLLIGDWDRHSKQWGWALQEKGNQIKAIPVPGDRDNAFFRIDGVIPTIITNKLVQPMVRPFEKDIDHLPGFVYPFDNYFLKDVPEKIFIEEAHALQESLTDAKMEAALKQWPKELQELNGKEILEKLKHRRNDLPGYAKEFRKLIEKSKPLQAPLKGSEDLDLPQNMLSCFECM